MYSIKTYIFCFLFCCFQGVLCAQGTTQTTDDSNNSASGNASISDYAELLEHYQSHPLNINTADRGAFDEMHLLTPVQIQALLMHRLRYGNYLSCYELQSVPGFDLETIRKILPFITVGETTTLNKTTMKKLLKGADQMVILFYEQPFQKPQGLKNATDSNALNDYLGGNFKTNIRYRCTRGSRMSIGFNADKDMGEPLSFKQKQKGFDFYSAHFFVKDMGFIRQLALGDYNLSIGQGLGVGSGFVLNKSIEVLQVHRYAAGLKPYRSMNEFGFFRGGAITLGSDKLSATCYVSYKKMDGNTVMTDTVLFEKDRFYNLIQTGYHRTVKELALKNTTTQKIGGAYVQTQLKRFHTGIGWVSQQTIALNHLVHLDLTFSKQNYSLFAEVAQQLGGGKALVAGMMASLNKDLDIAIIYRNYEATFQNSLSNAFSNGSSPTNENGLYLGTTLKLPKGFRVLGYADFFNSPMPKYRTNGPSHGRDYASAIQYQPSKAMKLELRYRSISNEANEPASTGETIGYLQTAMHQTLRLQLDYLFSKQLTFRTRVEQNRASTDLSFPQSGSLISQDIHFNSLAGRWGFDLRYCLFKSDGASTRMYTFENDVPYTFSMAQLNGNGSRFYFMMNYKLGRKCEVWVRYSNSFSPDETSLGSGLDKIDGNKKESVKVLLKIKF